MGAGEVAADADDAPTDTSGGGDAVEAPDAVVCVPGTADCDGIAANACEADTRTSLMHCGACGVACVTPMHGSAQCAMGRCEVACDAGHARMGDGCALIAAPRLVAPLSPHTVTSQTPRLRWALGAGSDGVRVELCRERACTTVVHRFDATGTSALTPMALAPGAWFWRAVGMQGATAGVAYSASWEFFVGHRSAPVNTAWGQTTDVNGDGYADLVFAAGGTIYTYAGSPRGLATTPTMLTPVPGQVVQGLSARGGDVDGDGFGDLLVHVAAPGEALGVALLYRGSATGVGGTAARAYDPVATATALLGDVNGDGYGDLALNQSILFGEPLVPQDTRTAPPASERSLIPLADLNGDGVADFGDCTFNRLRASCRPMSGSRSGTASAYGSALETIGGVTSLLDVDGDGYGDLSGVVPGADLPTLQVLYGGAATPTSITLSMYSIAIGAGDTNRDGIGDALVVNFDSAAGFRGATLTFGRADRVWTSTQAIMASAGVGVASAGGSNTIGDCDGDGVSEFAYFDSTLATLLVYGSTVAVTGVPYRRISPPSGVSTLTVAR
jgi:hypothetical protein